jgi:hypothetical protein
VPTTRSAKPVAAQVDCNIGLIQVMPQAYQLQALLSGRRCPILPIVKAVWRGLYHVRYSVSKDIHECGAWSLSASGGKSSPRQSQADSVVYGLELRIAW